MKQQQWGNDMEQHTPGPWKMAECKITPHNKEIEVNGFYIATAHGFVDGQNNAIANARLISAAPELFDALKNIIPLAEWATGETSPVDIDRHLLDAAYFAIKKATGTE